MLRQRILSAYAQINGITDNPQLAAVRAAEAAAQQTGLSKYDWKRLHYRMAYLLSGQRSLQIGGLSFFSVKDLSAHLQALADQSLEAFQKFSHLLMLADRTLDPQFEVWLEATGHAQALRAWRERLAN